MVENYVLREMTDWTKLDIDASVVCFLVYAILNRTGSFNILQNFAVEIVSYVGNLHICNFIDSFPLFVKILLACNSFRFFVIYLPSLMVKES